jgi:phosphate uptake regulator
MNTNKAQFWASAMGGVRFGGRKKKLRQSIAACSAQWIPEGAKTQEILRTAIDHWRGGQDARALSVRPQESTIRAECDALFEKLAKLTSGAGDATTFVDLMLISRHLERILHHAVCVSEQAADAALFQGVRSTSDQTA